MGRDTAQPAQQRTAGAAAKEARATEETPRGLTTKQWLSRRLADAIGLFATVVPLPLGYLLVDQLGDLFYRFAPGYRANVIDNLRHARGGDASLDELRALARQTFRYSARNFYDLTRLRRIALDDLAQQIIVLGSWEQVARAHERGKGIIFITGHMGAFDVAGQMIPYNGYHAVLMTVRTVSEFVHEGVTYLRGSKGFALEEATPGGLRRLLRGLRRGEAIGLATDRDFLRNGHRVTFFGEETTLPIGAVRLALETGAAIVPLICRRHRYHHTLLLDDLFYVTKTGDMEADLRRGLNQVVAILERHIRADPAQWVMFQRVWPSSPPPTVAVFPVGSPLEGRVLGGDTSSRAAEPPPPPP